jgi:hypothetical protein
MQRWSQTASVEGDARREIVNLPVSEGRDQPCAECQQEGAAQKSGNGFGNMRDCASSEVREPHYS